MHLHLGKRLSISEIIVAHMSQTYLEANPIVLGQGQPELLQEHCKLLFIKFKELKKATNKAQSLIATIALYREEAL